MLFWARWTYFHTEAFTLAKVLDSEFIKDVLTLLLVLLAPTKPLRELLAASLLLANKRFIPLKMYLRRRRTKSFAKG